MTAFATGTNKVFEKLTDENSAKDVHVNIIPTEIKYHVTVAWDSLNFTYNLGTWNPETHTYSNGNWVSTPSADIVVKNHSNTDITVDANFNGDSEPTKTIYDADTGLTATIKLNDNDEKVTLASAENFYGAENVKNAAQTTINVAVTGTPKQNTQSKVLGEVTVVFGKESTTNK